MRYKQLGDTGMFVSEVCLGTMTFGNSNSMWGSIAGLEQHEVNQIMERALAAGINFIDTADVYSIGQRSEEHTSELQSLMRISYAVFCLTKKTNHETQPHIQLHI